MNRNLKIKIDPKHPHPKHWLIVYTQGLYPADLEKFKKLLGNPMETKLYVFPSEYVSKVELIGPWRISDFVHAIANKIKRWLYR